MAAILALLLACALGHPKPTPQPRLPYASRVEDCTGCGAWNRDDLGLERT